MSAAADIETLFAMWEQNVDAVRLLSRALNQRHLKTTGVAPQLVAHLKRCAVDLATPRGEDGASNVHRAKVDKSALTIGEPKRIRCKEHLRFVASQPCVICGRQPTHAHHLRHAQFRGLSLKVSDVFTVPLCAIHHNDVHKAGREEQWWRERSIEPLEIADTLWRESRKRLSTSASGADIDSENGPDLETARSATEVSKP